MIWEKSGVSNKEFTTMQLIIKCNNENFLIQSPIVSIEKKMNEHTKAIIDGIVHNNRCDTDVLITNNHTNIEIIYKIDDKNEPLFTGIIKDIQTKTQGINENAVYYIHIEAYSYSYLLDVMRMKRSYQNIDMTYSELLENIIKDYENGYITNISGREKTGNGYKEKNLMSFTLQYEETDWEFLKRMASRFNASLVSDYIVDFPRIKFGVEFSSTIYKISNCNYNILRNTYLYREIVQNENTGFKESDVVQYEVFTNTTDIYSLKIGDCIEFKNQMLYVYEAYAYLKNHVLTHRYILSSKEGFYHKKIYNNKIVGLSLKGKVIKVANNLLKVHLDIDDVKQPIDKSYWFNYSTLYSKFYCMPELNDYVNIYFPTKDEFDAIALNSIKQSPSSAKRIELTANSNSSDAEGKPANSPIDFETLAGDEKVKMLATEQGKKVILDDRNGNITILCNDGTYIVLTDSNGISIITGNNINISAKGNVDISSGNEINIIAKEEISLSCGDSNISVKSDEIKEKATDIYLNE